MPEADERSCQTAIQIADRNPMMTPDAVEAATRAARDAMPGATSAQQAAWHGSTSSVGADDGR